ncbi:MAG: peptide deformylase [Clostridiales bacterium]|jgi:peptide deformylase|nr:peptide deformylase [Clostridiales bacterium]
MAIRKILQVGDPILNMQSKIVETFDERLHLLLDDMLETMVKAQGAGLAAPQVGVLKQAFVVSIDYKTIYEFINPSILENTGSSIDEEGCLSVIGVTGKVERPKRILVKAQDRYGEYFELKASGFLARAICHENDHLKGELFLQKIIKDKV